MNWISVKDRLPDLDRYVLVYLPDRPWLDEDDDPKRVIMKRVEHGTCEPNNRGLPYTWDEFGALSCFGHEVSHWMPLPPPPTGPNE